ncbi:MAG TPA: lytic transglycosylase domain-containing protein [Streptosporangiaceae bacterium]
MSHSRRAPHRKTPKITLIAAGSALALAGIAGTVAAWPSASPAASASVADASFSGLAAGSAAGSAARAGTLTGAAARDNGLAKSAQELKASEAAARQAAVRQAIARERARKAAQARAAARAAAARAAARAAQQQQAAAVPAAAAQPATASGSPQQIAQGMLGSYGWSASQFGCLQPLWNAESGWNVSASNTTSGAYGIPQALPGSKMASAGADWQTSAATQIRWGLGYIRSVYGSPCGAWSHEQAYGWY